MIVSRAVSSIGSIAYAPRMVEESGHAIPTEHNRNIVASCPPWEGLQKPPHIYSVSSLDVQTRYFQTRSLILEWCLRFAG